VPGFVNVYIGITAPKFPPTEELAFIVRITLQKTAFQAVDFRNPPCISSTREIRTDVNHSSPLSHHLTNPHLLEFQRPFASCQPVIYRFRSNSPRIRSHPCFHILPNHHRFQLTAGLPCALSTELLARFVCRCTRCLARPARRHNRRIARPLAANRQQTNTCSQTRWKALARAGRRYTMNTPSEVLQEDYKITNPRSNTKRELNSGRSTRC